MAQRLSALRLVTLAVILTTALLLFPITGADAQTPPGAGPTRSAPEAASGQTMRGLAVARRYMVAAANIHASEAGRGVLRDGGSAVDAAVAVQLVLNLVEPQSSGIGGGAFLIHWDATAKKLDAYDGRETAPAAAKPDRFLGVDGRPIPFMAAIASGASVGVPGALAMLEHAHRKHGRLSWARLVEPAIALARDGFAVSPRLSLLLEWMGPEAFSPSARRYFFDSRGKAWRPGHVLRNPEFAATLERIVERGASALHSGEIAQHIVDAATAGPAPGSDLTLADLSDYRPREREAVCVPYRGLSVCGMGPPSSGAHAIGQTLRLIEPFDLGKGRRAALNARAVHVIAEAQKLAYADRNRFIADPDFAPIPNGLLDEAYLAGRRKLIAPMRAAERVTAGEPDGRRAMLPGDDATIEAAGTSHMSIIDDAGNAVSMTTTIESAFGSRIWAAGFLLNNELTDFSLRPTDAQGRPIANRIEGGKRPRSSMSPTIVFDANGDVKAVLGSPGGSRIILYVLKSLVALVDWEMDAQSAAALANFGSRGSGLELEPVATEGWDWLPWRWQTTLWQALQLRPLGHRIEFDEMTSGTHIIVRRGPERLEGGVDPRREGVALGD
jgi:gamma-glutamyltranspeptidase/glutathione hydrolase